jgi:hypothetical protein
MPELRKVTYTDPDGRNKVVLLPNEADDSQAPYGVPVGPPKLDDLDLPLDIEVRLNNELHAREIFSPLDAIKKRSEVVAALQAALKVDANRIVDIYTGGVNPNAKKPSEEQPNPPIPYRRPRRASQRT